MKRNAGQDDEIRTLERAVRERSGDFGLVKRLLVAASRLGEERGGLPCPFCQELASVTIYPHLDYFSCQACGTGSAIATDPTSYRPCEGCGNNDAMSGATLCPLCQEKNQKSWRELLDTLKVTREEADSAALWRAVRHMGEEEMPCFACEELYSSHGEGELCPDQSRGESYYCSEESWREATSDEDGEDGPTASNPGPDEEIRRLERLAASGDEDARRRLQAMRERMGHPDTTPGIQLTDEQEALYDELVEHLDYDEHARRRREWIRSNLRLKVAKGIYDRALAEKGWTSFVDSELKNVIGPHVERAPWRRMPAPAIRREFARRIAVAEEPGLRSAPRLDEPCRPGRGPSGSPKASCRYMIRPGKKSKAEKDQEACALCGWPRGELRAWLAERQA